MPGIRRRVASGADDGTAGGLLDLDIAADVVHVMMGAEDMGQAPALLVQGLEDRLRHRRIDGGAGLRLGVVDQIDVVVAQDRNDPDVEFGHACSPLCRVLSSPDATIIRPPPFHRADVPSAAPGRRRSQWFRFWQKRSRLRRHDHGRRRSSRFLRLAPGPGDRAHDSPPHPNHLAGSRRHHRDGAGLPDALPQLPAQQRQDPDPGGPCRPSRGCCTGRPTDPA